MRLAKTVLICGSILSLGSPALAQSATNAYKDERLVANKASYNAAAVEDKFINAWGIAIRPKGAGGHFWVTAKDVSYEYVGDVKQSADEKLRTFHTDDLKYVTVPVGGDDKFSTGVVFSGSKENFVITQKPVTGDEITAPAKFIFASDGGIISAWTERKKEDGTFERADKALAVIDMSAEGAQLFGVAISANYDRLYAADFGRNPGLHVFDGAFKPAGITFDMPFDENKNGKFDAGEYAPFNVQAFTTPAGENRIFVTYALTQVCPAEEVAKGTCAEGALFEGEEEISQPGHGRIAEFTEDGKLFAVWNDGGKLSAPWGLAFAPANFGALSNTLLAANFGDGTIAAFDVETREFVDVLRDENGKPVEVDKIWGLLFGNGESLGDSNALYYAAGPEDETDGLFGSLRPVTP